MEKVYDIKLVQKEILEIMKQLQGMEQGEG